MILVLCEMSQILFAVLNSLICDFVIIDYQSVPQKSQFLFNMLHKIWTDRFHLLKYHGMKGSIFFNQT